MACIERIQRLARRLRTLARIDSAEASMEREMRAHIEFETADRIRAGLDPDAARAAALRDFGAIEAYKEAGRDARGTRAIEDFVRDLRHAARLLARHRAFSISAILTFALGIGAATAVFSVVYGVLLRPLPYAEPDRLMTLWEVDAARGVDRNVVSVASFEAWRTRATTFEHIAALVPAPLTLPAPDGPERVVGAEVSPGYFRMLGVQPMLGREFTEEEAAGSGVVVLSEAYWRTRMGADPGVIGRVLQIGGRPHEGGRGYQIVGVMPADFEPPQFGWLGRQAFWVPFLPSEENRVYGRYLLLVGRLRPDASEDSARAELMAVAAQRAQEDATANGGWSATVVPLGEQITGDVRDVFIYILGTVALLLVLAVTNVATLLLAHTRQRMHELGLRRALGATDVRLHRQILTECLLLGAAGSAAGILVAFPMADMLVSLIPPEVPRLSAIRVDTAVLAMSATVSLIASLMVGVAAARRGRRAPSVLLREGSARATGRAHGRALVIAEVAIGLIVAVLAGLVLRSFVSLRAIDLGFDPQGVVIGRVALGTNLETPQAQHAFFEELLSRIRGQAGVRHAGLLSGRPLAGLGPATSVRDVGALPTPSDLIADGRWADPELFRALRVPLLAGALFDADDRPGGPVRIIVNASMARALWPNENAVGKRTAIQLNGGLEATVIGVVGDLHLTDARTPSRAGFFLAPRQFGGEAYDIIVRSDADPALVIASMRAALRDMDPTLPLHRIQTLDALVAATMARDRFAALLLSSFAALALLLASVGIYGVFAGDVAARRKEIGIRMALGARRPRVLAGVLGRALTSALIGIALGGVAALLLAQSMRSVLFGVQPADAWSFLVGAGCLLTVTLVATLIPAAHAARVSPLIALRE